MFIYVYKIIWTKYLYLCITEPKVAIVHLLCFIQISLKAAKAAKALLDNTWGRLRDIYFFEKTSFILIIIWQI